MDMVLLSLSLWISGVISFYALYLISGAASAIVFPVTAIFLVMFTCKYGRLVTLFSGVVTLGIVLGAVAALRVEFSQFGNVYDTSTEQKTRFLFDADENAKKMDGYFSTITSKEAAAFFVALLTGRREYLSLPLRDIVRKSGISHLLALSGFHLGTLLFLLGSFRTMVPRIAYAVFSLCGVWTYCLWIGFIPSLWRAAIMYTVSTVGIFLTGKRNFFVTWSCAGLAMMVFSPTTLLEPGFVLSMLALAGVVIGGKYVCVGLSRWGAQEMMMRKRIFKKLTIGIVQTLVASAGAAVATSWYSMLVFRASYPIGIVVSVLVTPLVVLFMALGLGAMFVTFCSTILPSFSTIILYVLGHALEYIMRSVRFAAAHASLFFSLSTWQETAMFYGILGALCVVGFSARYWKNTKRHIMHKKKMS